MRYLTRPWKVTFRWRVSMLVSCVGVVMTSGIMFVGLCCCELEVKIYEGDQKKSDDPSVVLHSIPIRSFQWVLQT